VVTLDRRKLTAPLLAQAAAFVVVLVIGGVTGHESPSHPTVPVAHTSPPRITSAHSTKLTVQVSLHGGIGATTPGVPVEILKDHALTPLMSAQLTEGTPTDLVMPAGDYQVCVNPPAGWMFTGHNTGAVPGLDCTMVDARSPAQTVTFHLTFHSSNTGAVPT